MKNKNRYINILILSILFIMFFIIFILKISVKCYFNVFTGIFCPACGMTRAFYKILHFDILGAFLTNILSVFLFIYIVVGVIIILIDIIKNSRMFMDISKKLFSKYYILIIFAIILSFIYNNTINIYV